MSDESSELLTGWGRTAPTSAHVETPGKSAEVDPLLDRAGRRGLIARGLGRSYGDAAQNAGGSVIDLRGLRDVREFDVSTGRLRISAGASLDAIMRMTLPFGWFVPVTPGTRFVTVGGAIAADIHGKNHHVDGSFANHVESFALHTPKGLLEVSPHDDRELFWDTAGAMGLTGVVTEANLRLLPVETSLVSVDTERASDLDDLMARMRTGDADYRYSVAWIDCTAQGAALGRGVLTRGDHAPIEALSEQQREHALRFDPRTRITAPPWVPNGMLNRLTVRAFNEMWFRKAPRLQRGHLESIAAFFHPLDGVDGWNRLYGSRGFLQYQFVVPDTEDATLRRAVEKLSGAQCASFLAVLKRFGPGNPGALSFPIPGWTLALDIPTTARGLAPLLDELDGMVAEAGGRVYLAKDSRLRPDLLATMYPEVDRFCELRARIDPSNALQSDLSRRLGLT
jgi:decaprenylphospho-beta-D-ribofuranose 2-oxidase